MSGKPRPKEGAADKFKPPVPPKPGMMSALPQTSKTKPASQPVTQDDPDSPVGQDPFLGSEQVYGLNFNNFQSFLKSKDATLVLFYDPEDSLSYWCRCRFVKAAKATTKDNHAYAGVNCAKENDLCAKEMIKSLPAYKLYGKSFLLTTIDEISDFTSESMRLHVTNTPVLEDAPRPVRKCDT